MVTSIPLGAAKCPGEQSKVPSCRDTGTPPMQEHRLRAERGKGKEGVWAQRPLCHHSGLTGCPPVRRIHTLFTTWLQ